MNPMPPLLSLFLAMACAIGCGKQPVDTPVAAPATQPATSESKPSMTTLAPIPAAPTLTEDSLQAFQNRHSCRLPNDYRQFLLSNNGAFPTPDCVVFEEAGRKTASDVFCFFAIDDDRASLSLDWHLETYSDRLPLSTLPIGRDSCGNLWLISYGKVGYGSIYFWDHGSYDTFDETDLGNCPPVAESLQEFLDHLKTYDASSETGDVPSRYSLVKQAADSTAQQDPEFSTRANPDAVWHCDCTEDGRVRMQFVQYKIHAIATHTCGYNRLCAMKGLIEGGEPRLPE